MHSLRRQLFLVYAIGSLFSLAANVARIFLLLAWDFFFIGFDLAYVALGVTWRLVKVALLFVPLIGSLVWAVASFGMVLILLPVVGPLAIFLKIIRLPVALLFPLPKAKQPVRRASAGRAASPRRVQPVAARRASPYTRARRQRQASRP